MAQYFSLSYTLPTPLRTVNVADSTQLTAAIADATPGDRIVLANGSYSALNLVGLNGQLGNPIVFTAENARQVTISSSTSGRNIRLSNCTYLEFYGIRCTSASVWGWSMGPCYTTDTAVECHYIRIINCEIDNAGQELLTIGGDSSNIDIIGNSLHDSGKSGSGNPYAEGIYIGNGSTQTDRAHDILIQGNHLYRIGNTLNGGEAIDIKVQSYNITVVDNLIEEVTVDSQGAITVLLNNVNYPAGQTDPNILISRNVIHNVRRLTYDGAGIFVGANGVTVTNNLIWDTDNPSIQATTDASNTTGNFTVYNNTLWDGILVNASGVYGTSPVALIQKNNLIKGSGSTADDQVGVDADCIGPLTGTAISDTYTGSGFMLDANSLANDAGIELVAVPDDVTGAARPSGAYSMGAFISEAVAPDPDYTATFYPSTGGGLTVTQGSQVTVNPEASSPITSNSTTWENVSIGALSGAFIVEYEIVPDQSYMNGVTGLSFGSVSTYNDQAVNIRFYDNGTLDARNGGVYAADAVVPYTTGTSYYVRIIGNVTTNKYSVYITPDGSPEVLLANNYDFRTGQSGLPSLDNLAVFTESGSHTVSNFRIGGLPAGTVALALAAGADTTAVTAVPLADYLFTGWTGDITGTDNPLIITNVQADKVVTANFAGGDQTLTYTAGTGGSVTGTSPQTVAYGSDGTAVTAVPDANYSFVDWSDSSTQNPRTDTSVAGDITVTANFTIDTFTLTYSSGANGSLTGTTSQTVDYNTSGTAVTAVPSSGYVFVDWDDGSTSNPRTDATVTANLSVSASFALDAAEFTVTFAANNGTLTGDTSQLIVSGSDCTAVTVVPNANYHFTQWNDANTDNPRTLTNVTSTQTLTATCVIDTYSVDFTAGTGGSITGTASQTIDHGSDATQVTATAATDYAFTAWSGDYTGATNPLTITNVTADKTITASFESTIIDYTASTLVVSALSVLADGTSTSTITVQVKENGVNATSGGHTVVLSETGSATISSVTDNGDGTYTATVTSSTVESVTVSGTVNTEALANTKAITFTSGLITRTRTDNNVTGKIGGC